MFLAHYASFWPSTVSYGVEPLLSKRPRDNTHYTHIYIYINLYIQIHIHARIRLKTLFSSTTEALEGAPMPEHDRMRAATAATIRMRRRTPLQIVARRPPLMPRIFAKWRASV